MLDLLKKKYFDKKSVARKFGFVHLYFEPLRLQQFNYLTSVDTFSCLGGV